jgi:taurine dioxygenase
MATQSTVPTASYEVAPLGPDVPFGAIVSGLTLADLDDPAVRGSLFDLWIDRGVLLFRVENTADMHIRLSECFGQLERHVFPETWVDGRPELVKVKYYPDDGSVYEIDGELRGGWLPWHSDLVYTDTINRGGILRPMKLPASLGMTGLIDQIAAYDRLPDALKARIEGLHVVYAMDLNSANHKFGRPEQIRFVRGAKSFNKIVRREYEYPRILHPMVYVQGKSGRKVLNVSPAFALGIYEIGGPEGDDLLREVVSHCIDPALAYFHTWREGDMLLWDNWRTLHCATGVPVDQTREMHRTTISGDYALGQKLDRSAADLPRIDV